MNGRCSELPGACGGVLKCAAVAILLLFSNSGLAGDARESVALGERIYRDGVLPSGQFLKATIQGDVELTGEQLNCQYCHRRSGFGSSESGTLVPPVTGSALFAAQEPRRQAQFRKLYQTEQRAPGMRPAYDLASLGRAIREGIDPNGRVLDRLMPRYQLDEDELAALVAYLRTLSTADSPGVDGTTIHFATVVTDDVDAGERQAMLDVLNAYFRDRNAETRQEIDRAERGGWIKDWLYQAYRKWELHVWELSGPNETWGTQLEQLYARQPVFALLSGSVSGEWRPIHEFCERHEIPSLFPNTNLPVTDASGAFNLYFSKGVVLEAQILASYLDDPASGLRGVQILQVYRDNPGGNASAGVLQQLMEQREGWIVANRPIDERGVPLGWRWEELAASADRSIIVLWLTDDDLLELDPSLAQFKGMERVFVSASLLQDSAARVARISTDKYYVIYPYALPLKSARGVMRVTPWLRSRGIASPYLPTQANTYFAATITGMAVKRLIDNYSRDYLIEKIEHMVENSQNTGVYRHLSLAPGQRFASKGGFIARFSPENGDLEAVSDWITP